MLIPNGEQVVTPCATCKHFDVRVDKEPCLSCIDTDIAELPWPEDEDFRNYEPGVNADEQN